MMWLALGSLLFAVVAIARHKTIDDVEREAIEAAQGAIGGDDDVNPHTQAERNTISMLRARVAYWQAKARSVESERRAVLVKAGSLDKRLADIRQKVGIYERAIAIRRSADRDKS